MYITTEYIILSSASVWWTTVANTCLTTVQYSIVNDKISQSIIYSILLEESYYNSLLSNFVVLASEKKTILYLLPISHLNDFHKTIYLHNSSTRLNYSWNEQKSFKKQDHPHPFKNDQVYEDVWLFNVGRYVTTCHLLTN